MPEKPPPIKLSTGRTAIPVSQFAGQWLYRPDSGNCWFGRREYQELRTLRGDPPLGGTGYTTTE